jgi:hypothetical protein
VRDESWHTAPYEIQDEEMESGEHHFSISYVAVYRLNAIYYKARYLITGDAEGTITFHMQGEALSSFKRNRIGICVLHPVTECAGKPVVVTRVDGTTYEAHFPKSISPHQPFLDIQQLSWNGEAAGIQLHFEGDVFETEDQRNWTDSSYKTYSTPLGLPFPVAVNKGDTIDQKVTLRVAPNKSNSNNREPGDVTREKKLPFPKIGFCRTPGSALLNDKAIELLKKIPFHHYRTELHLDENGWREELQRAATEAALLNAKLELVLFFSSGNNAAQNDLLEQLQKSSAALFAILILAENEKVTPEPLLRHLYPALKERFPEVQIGYGTDRFFAEFNRNRPASETPYDYVSFPLNPQVHASDTRSILENLETQHHTLQTLHTFTDKPAHVSPVMFTARHLPLDTQEEDTRQQTYVAAWWLLKAVQNMAGADALTLCYATGAAGLMLVDERQHTPKRFRCIMHLHD